MVVGAGDVRHQAQQVIANLTEALAAAGAALTDVLKTTIYVASSDRRDLLAAWGVVRAAFGEHDAPRRLLGVATVGYRDQLVEVGAVAPIGSWIGAVTFRRAGPPIASG